MQSFTDSQGRTWSVVINVGAIKRVRDLLDVDLLDVASGDLLSRLADDPCVLVDVLFALCKPEADSGGVTDEDFGRAMVGGVLDAASAALLKELLDFFPSAQRARACGNLARAMEAQEAALKAAAEAMRPSPRRPAAAEKPGGTQAETFGDASGNSPASADATPPA